MSHSSPPSERGTLREAGSFSGQLIGREIDPPTGARTRRAGLAELNAEIAHGRRARSPLSVAIAAVIGLEAVNATLGYAAGD